MHIGIGQKQRYGSQPNLAYGYPQAPPQPYYGGQPMPGPPQQPMPNLPPQPLMGQSPMNPQGGSITNYPPFQPMGMPNYPGQQQPRFGLPPTYPPSAVLRPPQPNQETVAPSAGKTDDSPFTL
jgi:hypothetical protein